MASTYIEVNENASDRLSPLIVRTIRQGRTFAENMEYTKDVMEHVTNGGTEWDTLATMLGVTNAEAESVYTLFNGVNMNNAPFNDLIDRLG